MRSSGWRPKDLTFKNGNRIRVGKMELEDKNIVFIVCDTLSAFHLPFHGYDRDTAPFLTELKEDNTWFKYAYSNAPWTIPAHASIFSGELPKEHGCNSDTPHFEGPSFVEELKERGYRTLCYSNNPAFFTGAGFGRGFDRFLQGPEIYSRYAGGPALQKVAERDNNDEYAGTLEKYTDFAKEAALNFDLQSISAGLKILYESQFGDQVGENVIEDSGTNATNQLIKEHLKEEDQPFFLFINYMENHRPWVPPDRIAEDFVEDYREKKGRLQDIMDDHVDKSDITKEEVENLRGLYDAATKYLDTKLEEIYNHLNERFEDTVFIIVSDHGENLGHYGLWHHKYGVFERLVRVPAIIAGDDVEGRTIEKNMSLRRLKDLIMGDKGIDDLGEEKVYSEYYGTPKNMPRKSKNIGANRSKCVVRGKEGLIEHTNLENFGFEASNTGFSEDNRDIDSWEELSEDLDRVFGTETEGLDI